MSSPLFGPTRQQPVLFGWWPRSEDWCLKELVEWSTRCLPAVRPGVDTVALPLVPDVQQLWECWTEQSGLADWQALWFAPDPRPCLGEQTVKDPSTHVAGEMLATFKARIPTVAHADQQRLQFYPAFVTQELLDEASSRGFDVILGLEGEPWAHPHVLDDGNSRTLCLADLLPEGAVDVRARRGYAASSRQSLYEAWKQLKRECTADARLELRPREGSGRAAPVVVLAAKDLDAFDFGQGRIAVLEEAFGSEDKQGRITLFMFGDEPCPWLLFEDVPSRCVEVAQQVNQALMLEGIWSLDFTTDAAGTLVLVDVEAGQPGHKMALLLWASRVPHPVALSMSTYSASQEGKAVVQDALEVLRSQDLLWDGDEGIILYQHASGGTLACAIASSFGIEAVAAMSARLAAIMLETFGLKAESVCTVL